MTSEEFDELLDQLSLSSEEVALEDAQYYRR